MAVNTESSRHAGACLWAAGHFYLGPQAPDAEPRSGYSEERVMATFVLVHGAWHGSWCWKRVRRLLQSQGHEVFTPTLTGVGERSHLLSPAVTLETHVIDVVNLIRWEELSDVVLCGHSYGGAVVTGVTDRLPDRVASLVYLDAFIPESGSSVATKVNGSIIDGWKVQPISAERFNVNLEDRAWVDRQCTAQSIDCWLQPLHLERSLGEFKNVTYVLATAWGGESPPFRSQYVEAQALGWRSLEIECGHDVMLDN
jgi:pimeloyl-ACP methyl ester carboxylesterase